MHPQCGGARGPSLWGVRATPQSSNQAGNVLRVRGLIIEYKQGHERAGFGVLDKRRVVLGMDHPSREAISRSVLLYQGFAVISTLPPGVER